MTNLIFAFLCFCLGISITLMVLTPVHVTRHDNPITGRLIGAVLALISFSAGGAFLEAALW